MSARIAIGFGATSSARVEDVVRLIEATLSNEATRAVFPSPPTATNVVIATLDRRAALARDVGAALGCAVATFDAATLASVGGVVTASPRALASIGTASVAEAAALAALGARARLVVTRATGGNCTCAIAESS